ncbi:MAG: 50S ribosomal protein L13 [bacterium]
MKTFMANEKHKGNKWYVLDAQGVVLGRLATKIANILRGKNNPKFTPHVDLGDHVIVVNAEKVMVTGKKISQKKYYRHSFYPGGLKETTLGKLLKQKPELVITYAVKGMLPKNKLGRKLSKKLKVYAGTKHPHKAQIQNLLEA